MSILPNVISIGVSLASKAHWTIAMKKLLKERWTWQPHPHASIHRPISIQQKFFKHLSTTQKIDINCIKLITKVVCKVHCFQQWLCMFPRTQMWPNIRYSFIMVLLYMNKALQAAVILWQGYIPEKCCANQNHANRTQNYYTKQSISWGLGDWQPPHILV